MSDDAARHTDSRLEMASAVVLSIAALLSSWASYQASLWDGDQAARYSQAEAMRIEASRIRLEGDTRTAIQLSIYSAWLEATARGDDRLAQFYHQRMPPGLRPAFDAWVAEKPLLNQNASSTPFDTPAYKPPLRDAAEALERKAADTYQAGQRANTISDGYGQGATFLAMALFFGGIGQVFSHPRPRLVLLSLGAVALVFGVVRLLTLPVQILGLTLAT